MFGRPLQGLRVKVKGVALFHGFTPVAILGTPLRGSEFPLPPSK